MEGACKSSLLYLQANLRSTWSWGSANLLFQEYRACMYTADGVDKFFVMPNVNLQASAWLGLAVKDFYPESMVGSFSMPSIEADPKHVLTTPVRKRKPAGPPPEPKSTIVLCNGSSKKKTQIVSRPPFH